MEGGGWRWFFMGFGSRLGYKECQEHHRQRRGLRPQTSLTCTLKTDVRGQHTSGPTHVRVQVRHTRTRPAIVWLCRQAIGSHTISVFLEVTQELRGLGKSTNPEGPKHSHSAPPTSLRPRVLQTLSQPGCLPEQETPGEAELAGHWPVRRPRTTPGSTTVWALLSSGREEAGTVAIRPLSGWEPPTPPGGGGPAPAPDL